MRPRIPGWTLRSLFAFLLVAPMASRCAESAVLTISGVVHRMVAITVKPQNNYNSLDLVSGEKDKQIAVVNECSNLKSGYTVLVSSEGMGASREPLLRGATPGNQDTVPYALKFRGRPVRFKGAEAVLSTGTKRTERAGIDSSLTVTIPPVSNVADDTYADTLRFTIQAN